MWRVYGVGLIGWLWLGLLPAQAPRFDTVVIKPAPAAEMANGTLHGFGAVDPSRWRAMALTVHDLINYAYGIKVYDYDRLLGLPPWTDTAVYDIEASIPPGVHQSDMPVMVRNMLADRFKLAAHVETRPLPAGFLSLAPGGPRLKRNPDCERGDQPLQINAGLFAPSDKLVAALAAPPHMCDTKNATAASGVVKWSFHGVTMAQLADFAGSQSVPVVDETGLNGAYDFDLSYPMLTAGDVRSLSREQLAARADLQQGQIAAAYEHQLGLKLERRRLKKLPVSVVVVDHIEHPTPN